MMDVLIVGAIVIAILGGVVWLASVSKRDGAINERERQNRKAIENAELANSVRRDITRRGAIERLRHSKHNTDNVPTLSTDPLLGRRSTDHER